MIYNVPEVFPIFDELVKKLFASRVSRAHPPKTHGFSDKTYAKVIMKKVLGPLSFHIYVDDLFTLMTKTNHETHATMLSIISYFIYVSNHHLGMSFND